MKENGGKGFEILSAESVESFVANFTLTAAVHLTQV
jgi:hypothetical protein